LTKHDVIIVGSGAGGAAAAYRLARAGKRVLLVEKGPFLPRDASTLDVREVFINGAFKNHDAWSDGQGHEFTPSEFYNVGGKTKWYGAALFRFRPQEFQAEPDFGLLGWPFGYEELEPFYDEASDLLEITAFANEPELQSIVGRITAADPNWKAEPLPLGLSKAILSNPEEAKHFDGFASPSGYKSDAERNLIDHILDLPDFTLLAGDPVTALISASDDPRRIVGVECVSGARHEAGTIVLAAGAMTSPRILQDYLRASGLRLPCDRLIGGNFKMHINSAIMGFSPFVDHDVLRKTAVFFNERYPHSSMQCLGWMDADMLAALEPSRLPRFLNQFLGKRAIGFWATTEDGSSPENRVISGEPGGRPTLDYSLDRIMQSRREHEAMIEDWRLRLLEAGLIGFEKYTGIATTSHALGSMVMGADPSASVVDAHGKVHGLEGLYVGDGSPLPRSSRVNPSLTIYAWGLRLGHHLAAA
jgi:choline dehydrogenase-like flavoprotein